MELLIFGGLIVIIIILLILTLIPTTPALNPNSTSTAQMKGPYNINKTTTIFTGTDFLTNSSITFQGFINLEKLQKTGISTPCSSTDPSLPSCDTGRYSLCSCIGNDCKKCYHQGYITLMNFNDICKLEALGAPDSSRQGQAMIQFTIKTQSSGDIVDEKKNPVNPEFHAKDSSGNSAQTEKSDIYLETFVLPPLYFQKWTMITISREGRRFDFYYNNVLVLSKQTSTVLYNSPLSSDITVGNSSLNGSVGFFTLYNTIQSSVDINKQYTSFTTTRGSPIFDSNPEIGLTNLSLDRLPIGGLQELRLPNLCPSGDCVNNPVNPPSLPYYEWSSSYA